MRIDAKKLRIHIYEWILEKSAVPTSTDLAPAMGESADDVRAALAELRIGKTALVHPQSGELWMAGPFSAIETPYRVVGRKTSWFANCAWDMLGVAILADEPVRIEARCTDCGTPMTLHVEPRCVPTEAGVVHFLVPARRWYDDIGFT